MVLTGGPPSAGAGGGDGAAGGGSGVGSATSVMSGGSGRDRSTCPPSDVTGWSFTTIRTRLTAGKFVTIVFTTEYTVSSSAFEPPGRPDVASDDRSTQATPRACTNTSRTRVPAGSVGTRPVVEPFASSSTTVRSCRARSAEKATSRSSGRRPSRSGASK